MPDLDLVIDEEQVRLFSLLHPAEPVLLKLEKRTLKWNRSKPRLRIVEAQYRGDFDIPVLGPLDLPEVILVRPDGYVAWAGNCDNTSELEKAIAFWFE